MMNFEEWQSNVCRQKLDWGFVHVHLVDYILTYLIPRLASYNTDEITLHFTQGSENLYEVMFGLSLSADRAGTYLQGA